MPIYLTRNLLLPIGHVVARPARSFAHIYVPKSTLKDHLSGCVEDGCHLGPKPYRSEEEELTSHLLSASKIGLGKTRYEVTRIVEGVAKQKRVLRGEQLSRVVEMLSCQIFKTSLRSEDSTAGVCIDTAPSASP